MSKLIFDSFFQKKDQPLEELWFIQELAIIYSNVTLLSSSSDNSFHFFWYFFLVPLGTIILSLSVESTSIERSNFAGFFPLQISVNSFL